jgi:predicted nucleic-acid-binding Zn-ribbon protein
VWIPKSEQSHFRAYVCGACGYTEFYAENYVALNEGRRKGYKSS